MKKIDSLIVKIKKSNLSARDKRELLLILEQKHPDYNKFLIALFHILKIGKEYVDLFDVDIGELIDKFF